MAFTWKGLVTFLIYGLVIGALAYLGYWSAIKVAKLGADIGAIVGALLGAILIVLVWAFVGKNYVSGKDKSLYSIE